jgi:dihydrofolate synthase/folylpolyglutamate synthase
LQTHPVLQRLSQSGVRLGLSRVGAFLAHLGHPERSAPVLHVAGTNGKGGVCAIATACLRARGLTVGTYTSPHLSQLNERIRVGGQPISDPQFSRLIEEIVARAAEWARDERPDLAEDAPPLTYYEAMTAAAFVHFARAQVDVAVIEVGLGGRLDATNVVQAATSVITSIGLDHCEQLGSDHASVAAEKAGILREGVPVVLGPLPRAAMRVVRSMAETLGAPARIYGEHFRVSGDPRSFSWENSWGASPERVGGLRTRLNGAFQIENAAVAIAALVCLGEQIPQLRIDEGALMMGLSAVSHPGRCEWLSEDLLVDGAHNDEGARRLAEYLSTLPRRRRRTLLLGASADKDIRSIAAALAPQVDRVFTTRCAHPRAAEPGSVAEALVGLSCPVMPAGPIEDALPLARRGGDLVIAAGSLFLVGAVRDIVGPVPAG